MRLQSRDRTNPDIKGRGDQSGNLLHWLVEYEFFKPPRNFLPLPLS